MYYVKLGASASAAHSKENLIDRCRRIVGVRSAFICMNEHVPENASPESRPGTCDLHRRAGKTELRLFILVFADELVPDEWVGISEAIAIKKWPAVPEAPPETGGA
jgi:hypothetical protein